MFHTIAVPHRDILEGRLTMDVFAADLWEVFKGRGPDEYKDEVQFFQKTYLTEGLKDLLILVEKRLQGKGGDPVVQLQTPFGGGKTHALIAMYHQAKKWGVKTVVLVGEKLKTGSKPGDFDTLWGLMEEQLTGEKKEFASPVPPGGEQIEKLLSAHAPVLILIDELIPYLNTADAVAVGNVSLTTLALTFLHNLTNVVSGMPAVSLVVTTTPSNPYNRTSRGEEIVADLQNITARREIIKSPVQEQEITQVIRRRLFSHIDLVKAGGVIKNFMDYATKESILPVGTEPSAYRRRFESAYPFLPEVIDVLYHRWGSFTNFQRTRGVLRLLSLVVYSLKESSLPFISLADFDLNNQEIRRELLRHTGPEYDSIVAADITGEEAGSKKVEASMGDAYKGLRLGTRAAVTIFLYSFSGGPERGVTLGELKRTATTVGNPASVVAEVLEQLKDRLFYIQYQSGKYYFTNQPNLNLILRNRMENIQEKEMAELEKDLLKKNLAGGKLKTFLWPQENSEIPDNIELKLIVLKKQDDAFMKQVLETKGGTPRVNRNTLFFLAPLFSEQGGFANLLKKVLAYRLIGSDKTLNLSED
jgi:predicted AAA+ superfamily ATPase